MAATKPTKRAIVRRKAVKVVGNNNSDDAKIAGIARGLTFTGVGVFTLKYFHPNLSSRVLKRLYVKLSTKTTNPITAITTSIRKMIVNALKAPDRPEAKNCPNAPGSSAIIPT